MSPEWMDKNYRGKTCPGYDNLKAVKVGKPIYAEHDDNYYLECVENLKGKGIKLE